MAKGVQLLKLQREHSCGGVAAISTIRTNPPSRSNLTLLRSTSIMPIISPKRNQKSQKLTLKSQRLLSHHVLKQKQQRKSHGKRHQNLTADSPQGNAPAMNHRILKTWLTSRSWTKVEHRLKLRNQLRKRNNLIKRSRLLQRRKRRKQQRRRKRRNQLPNRVKRHNLD